LKHREQSAEEFPRCYRGTWAGTVQGGLWRPAFDALPFAVVSGRGIKTRPCRGPRSHMRNTAAAKARCAPEGSRFEESSRTGSHWSRSSVAESAVIRHMARRDATHRSGHLPRDPPASSPRRGYRTELARGRLGLTDVRTFAPDPERLRGEGSPPAAVVNGNESGTSAPTSARPEPAARGGRRSPGFDAGSPDAGFQGTPPTLRAPRSRIRCPRIQGETRSPAGRRPSWKGLRHPATISPEHPLVAKGYPSSGSVPCTTRVARARMHAPAPLAAVFSTRAKRHPCRARDRTGQAGDLDGAVSLASGGRVIPAKAETQISSIPVLDWAFRCKRALAQRSPGFRRGGLDGWSMESRALAQRSSCRIGDECWRRRCTWGPFGKRGSSKIPGRRRRF